MNILDLLTTLGRWGQEHPQTVLLGCGVVPLAAGLTGLVRRYRQEASDVLGSVGDTTGNPRCQADGAAWRCGWTGRTPGAV